MVAETPAFAALSQADLLLLAAFLNPALALTDLADEAGLTFTEILAWASRPEIKAELDALRTLAAMRSELHASNLHTPALATLTTLLESSDSPVESRRIATTVVRATAPRRPRASRAHAAPPTSPDDPPDLPQHSDLNHERPGTPPPEPPPALLPHLLPLDDTSQLIQPLPALDDHLGLEPPSRAPRNSPHALLHASGRAEPRARPPRPPPMHA